jgi:hypothetical protein
MLMDRFRRVLTVVRASAAALSRPVAAVGVVTGVLTTASFVSAAAPVIDTEKVYEACELLGDGLKAEIWKARVRCSRLCGSHSQSSFPCE